MLETQSLNLQFQHKQGNMGGWEARRSDRDMCENRRAEESATTKSVRNTSFQLYRFNTSTPLLRC